MEMRVIDENVFLAICIIIIYLYICNMSIDNNSKRELSNTVCHKEVKDRLPEIDKTDRLIIESVIYDYQKKRSMNKSNCSRIIDSIKKGAFRGAIGGAIVGNGINGSLTGALVFGTINGLMRSYELSHNKNIFLMNTKDT